MKIFRLMPALLAVAFTFAGCGDDKGNEGGKKYYNTQRLVLICDEGNYLGVPGDFSYFDVETGEVQNEVYQAVNGKTPGGVCETITIIGNKAYLCVSDANKVIVMDALTYQFIKEIPVKFTNADIPDGQPKYIVPVSGSKAYVITQEYPYVAVLNLDTDTITGYIDNPFPIRPSAMASSAGTGSDAGNSASTYLLHEGYLYVPIWSYGDQIYKIDTSLDLITDVLNVHYQPNSLVLDKNGKMWALSDGGWDGWVKASPSALSRIDLTTFTVEEKMVFEAMEPSFSKLRINKSGDRLYYLVSSWENEHKDKCGLHSMSIDAAQLPTQPFISQPEGSSFYALGIDPFSQDIYLSDALDYSQRGVVYRYSASGNKISDFKVGVGPGSFCFKEAVEVEVQ